MTRQRIKPIRSIVGLGLIVVLLVATPSGLAETIQRAPCEAVESGDFERYRERQLATLKAEQAAATRQGLSVRIVRDLDSDLGTESDYLARQQPGVRCERIVYESDGLKIRGFLWTPSALAKNQKIPIIVFNRGGSGEDSKLRPNTQFGFERFVRAGYAVIGSPYRGNDGSEGSDELGGADVRDVLRLAKIARELPFADANNLFAMGYSRGAMMALSALRDGATFNAVALVGLPSDFRTSQFDRRFSPSSPQMAAARAQRSAVLWAERLDTPMLLLQGSGDPLVSTAEQTLPFAARLQALGKPYELVVYEGDSHGLILNGKDRDARILNWFERFRR
ncbi:MAG: alpha/beta hydrolase family protein [Gammaproteobacteria bacterium]